MAKQAFIIILFVAAGISVVLFVLPGQQASYSNMHPSDDAVAAPTSDDTTHPSLDTQSDSLPDPLEPIVVTHQDTPDIVKGVYVTEYTFASPARIADLISLSETTELNALVIDIQSHGDDLFVINENTAKGRLALLHEKGIYLIARLVAFNDEQGGWYDPASKERWTQIKKISHHAIELGFDEINYDYMRYPGPSEPDSITPVEQRTPIITSFFKFLKEEVRDETGRPISLDIFGSTFVYEETHIGQRMEDAVKYFDYIMPMPYPSHWANGTFGYEHPGRHPYEIVYQGLKVGWDKVKDDPERIAQLRTWIQDFNLESVFPIVYYDYTPEMIHQQIYACYHNGCEGWVFWNPRNEYRKESLIIPPTPPAPTPDPAPTASTTPSDATSTTN